MRKGLREILQTALLSLVIFGALQMSIQNFRVEGSSMEATLHSGQYLLVNKLVYYRLDMDRLADSIPFVSVQQKETRYLFHPPQRGEVVVFRFPLDPSRDFVKRVIAVPGDTVEIRGGVVYVNGRRLEEPYTAEASVSSMGAHVLGVDEYFVLGDNRAHSNDSRSWGAVTSEDIIGKAWITYWPFSDLRIF